MKAGLLERPARACFRTTQAGREALAAAPERIDLKFLNRFEGVREFRSRTTDAETPDLPVDGPVVDGTPQEVISAAVRPIHEALEREILERVAGLSPTAFEELIVKLMVAMGYGAGGDNRRIGKSGDGGVDGIITEDRLGLDVVYLQAKRYDPDDKVGPGAVREFVGSLAIRRAGKGVFVTTSGFSDAAEEVVRQAGQRIVLIDGHRLARLMIAHGVGVRVAWTHEIKELDLNFFEAE